MLRKHVIRHRSHSMEMIGQIFITYIILYVYIMAVYVENGT